MFEKAVLPEKPKLFLNGYYIVLGKPIGIIVQRPGGFLVVVWSVTVWASRSPEGFTFLNNVKQGLVIHSEVRQIIFVIKSHVFTSSDSMENQIPGDLDSPIFREWRLRFSGKGRSRNRRR